MSKALKELLDPLKPESPNWEASPYVFMNPETEDKYVDVGHAFGRVADRTGLTDVTFHTLRHTFASRLAQVGVPLNTIRELLGHGTMVMTMRYAHLAPNNLREAVEMLAMGSSAEEMRTRGVQNNPSVRRAL